MSSLRSNRLICFPLSIVPPHRICLSLALYNYRHLAFFVYINQTEEVEQSLYHELCISVKKHQIEEYESWLSIILHQMEDFCTNFLSKVKIGTLANFTR